MFTSLRRHSFLIASITAGCLFFTKAFYIGTSSLHQLALTHWIIDDAFIVMRVARNIALGFGFTYDFVHPTTGAPPLWAYVTSINHLLFSLDWAVKSTIIEMAFFGMLSTLLVYLIARKISGKEEAGWIAFILASLTGNAFFQAMNGMETAMFTFGVLLSISLWLGIGKPARVKEWHWKTLAGIAAGLTSMIRGDGIFIVIAIGFVELWEWIRAPRGQRSDKAKSIFGFAGMWILFFGALTIWQMVRTGSPLLGNQVGRRELALAMHGFSFDHFVLSNYLRIVVWNAFQLLELLSVALGSWLLLLCALVPYQGSEHRKRLTTFVGIYATLFLGTLVVYQWYFPDLHGLRYLNPLAHLVFALIGAGMVTLGSGALRVWRWIVIGAIVVVSQYGFYDLCIHMAWGKGMSFIARPSIEEQEKGFAAIDWAKKNIPANTVVAVRDHGRFALFTDLPVQDIAGTIDPVSPMLVKNGGLGAYLLSRNVKYAVIPPPDVRGDLVYQAMFRELRLTRVQGSPSYGLAEFYRVQKR